MKDIFRFKNDFFLKINSESVENWVEIENLYYQELKKIVKSKSTDVTIKDEIWKKDQYKRVKKLNEEFSEVKELLEKYLTEKIETPFQLKTRINEDNSWTKFYHILKPISIFNNEDKLKLEINFCKLNFY